MKTNKTAAKNDVTAKHSLLELAGILTKEEGDELERTVAENRERFSKRMR